MLVPIKRAKINKKISIRSYLRSWRKSHRIAVSQSDNESMTIFDLNIVSVGPEKTLLEQKKLY